jgi:hypothetical protein
MLFDACSSERFDGVVARRVLITAASPKGRVDLGMLGCPYEI